MIPDHFRGFVEELLAERRGEPVYPVWDDMPGFTELQRTRPELQLP